MIKFPFTSLQQCNLDWIMEQLHKILQFMPMNGAAGDVLQRNADGAAWMPIAAISLDIHSMDALLDPVAGNDELPIYDNSAQGNFKATVSNLMLQAPVQSVNGQTGDVVLTAADVGALPDSTVIPENTSDLVNDSGFVDAAGAAAAAPVQSVAGKTGTVTLVKGDVGLGNVDNVQQYSASNPPPYPVTSVNGMTGDVVIGGGGSVHLLFGTEISITASNADVNIITQSLKAQKTSDGKALRIYGNLRCYGIEPAGWKTFSISGISVHHPQSSTSLTCSALRFFNGDLMYQTYNDTVITVDTSGNITISAELEYGNTGIMEFRFLPIIIPLE